MYYIANVEKRARYPHGTPMIGEKIGKLLVLEEVGTTEYHHKIYKCQCDCGNIVEKPVRKGGKTATSCGCARKMENNRRWTGVGEISGTIFKHIRKDAVRRGHEFSLTKEIMWQIFLDQNGKCKYTGLQLSFGANTRGHEKTASLDRIDSSKGYIEGNIQWVHKDINFMKRALEERKFLEYIKLIFENRNLAS